MPYEYGPIRQTCCAAEEAKSATLLPLVPDQRYAMFGATLAPGYEQENFELGIREQLLED